MGLFQTNEDEENQKHVAPVSRSTISMSTASYSSLSKGENERGHWTGRMDFLLSCIGFAVGLGNIWRFPYLCYKSGGGAFLIPYVIFLVLCGMPLFFMEIAYGQFASLSPITVWRISPLFKGIGYGMVIISGIVCVYYNIIITWTFYYLFMSMRKVLPWSDCTNHWNDEHCVDNVFAVDNSTGSLTSADRANHSVDVGHFDRNLTNTSIVFNSVLTDFKYQTASEQFWERNVLEITDGIENLGSVRWSLLGCLALAWLVVFLCLCKGVKSSGRVVYITATFPYVVLTTLLIRGLTLPGAMDGIRFYLVPDWSKLLEFKVWGDAAIQIFYSVGMAWGGLITMASYNKFHNNVYRDAIIVPLINCGTSVFAGLVIFSVLGFMAYETGADVKDVVTQGPGLTFVVYPAAVARLPISPLWAILFFLMIFTIGLDSQFAMFETMTSAFIDEFPSYLQNKKVLFTAAMCFVEFLLGIPCIMQGGIYILQIMDWYCATFSLMLLSLMECLIISWIYGIDRFYKDIQLMIGFKPCSYWKVMWRFVTPVTIAFVWLFSVSQLEPVTYGAYPYMYKWHRDDEKLLPQHYKDRCREFMTRDPLPVHYRFSPNKYTVCEKTGQRVRVQNVPPDLMFPSMSNEGLWGGEGIIVGLRKKKKTSPRWPKIYRPYLIHRVLYSEILDKHFIVAVTHRTLQLIDENFGLDFYILKTHEVDLCSKLGIKLKRELLITLVKASCYPNDPEKQAQIMKRYGEFIIPLEEAEWIGLSVEEALQKVDDAKPEPQPLKEIFMEELTKKLSETSVTKPKSLLEKVNPFSA